MAKTAKKGDWVRIEQIILRPEQRLESLPEATKSTFEMLDQRTLRR